MKRTKTSQRKSRKTVSRRKPAAAVSRKYHSRAVAKALEIVETLKRSPEPLTLSELSRTVRLTKASLLRIVETLAEGDYLKKNSAGGYMLSPQLSSDLPAWWVSRLIEVAVPELKHLTRQFNESSALGQLFANHIEVLAVSECRQVVRMGNAVGRILQPHASSLGKVITAFQSEKRAEHLVHSYGLLRLTERTITDESELRKELRRVRKQGFAVDNEETTLGGQCFGAPIQSPWNEVVAAVSVSVPKMRVGPAEHQEKIIAAVKAAAARITEALASG